MHKLLVPKEVKISEIIANGSLSTNNYKRISIENDNQEYVRCFLKDNEPFKKGIEPGSGVYVNNSKQIFLRNSCITDIQYTVQKEKYTFLNPNYYDENVLDNENVIFCTDANIGDCCLFISENEKVILSSGLIKLNFKDEKSKYYVLAFMKDEYFREQLFALTPKGATIRHSGDLFLQCKIPICNNSWVFELFENVVKNISYAEHIAGNKIKYSERMIYKELMVNQYEYENPTIGKLLAMERLDSGIYSDTVFQWRKNVENYKWGYETLDGFGFELKRGPNLAKRDLGRSIQTDEYRKGYSILIYPSDISSSGYIEKVSYLGARNPIWYLGERDILFSSEGTIGKTFVVCDKKMHFTTNFHGTIIRPKNDAIPLEKSIYLGLYINFLRSIGVFDCMSVGANGGSFAVGYWDNVVIPKLDESVVNELAKLYNNEIDINPVVFNKNKLEELGIYQLNEFLISEKALLRKICSDIKNNDLKDKELYCHYTE